MHANQDHSAAASLILGSFENVFNVAEINHLRCLEESGQLIESI